MWPRILQCVNGKVDAIKGGHRGKGALRGDCVLAGISGEWAEAWRAIGLAAATWKGAGSGHDSLGVLLTGY